MPPSRIVDPESMRLIVELSERRRQGHSHVSHPQLFGYFVYCQTVYVLDHINLAA